VPGVRVAPPAVRAIAIAVAVATLGTGTDARAQGALTDSTPATPEYFPRGGPLAHLHLVPYGDVRLWAERVEHRPGIPDPLERRRATLRVGLDWGPWGRWPVEARAGARASLGSDRNPEGRASFDNLASDTVEVDELVARASSPRGDAIALGKMRMPLALSELLWDVDLRPVGVGLRVPVGPVGPVSIRIAGAVLTRARFSTDDARVAAVQAGARWESAPDTRAEVELSYLAFNHLEDLPEQGFARQNASVVGTTGRSLASEFRILDLQWAGERRWGAWPVSIRLEGSRNLAVDRDRDAARTRLAAGGAGAPHGLEIGWVHQRIEREAVCGAFNSDDWWFHSRARGNLVWGAGGVGGPLLVRASMFFERRDDLAQETRRYRLEVAARVPER